MKSDKIRDLLTIGNQLEIPLKIEDFQSANTFSKALNRYLNRNSGSNNKVPINTGFCIVYDQTC